MPARGSQLHGAREPTPSALTSLSPRGAPAGSRRPPHTPILARARLPQPPRPRFRCPPAPRCRSCRLKPSRRSCLLPPPPPRWTCSRTCTEGDALWQRGTRLVPSRPLHCHCPQPRTGMPGAGAGPGGWQEPLGTYSPFSTPTNCRLFLLPSASLRGGPSRFFMMDFRAPGGREMGVRGQ